MRSPFDTPDYTGTDVVAAFSEFGDVRMPQDAEAPILGPATRAALQGWLHELNYASELAAVGVKPRQRALLQGPPGTGKTTLAWHVAARLGLPLVVIEAPSVLSKWVNQSGETIGKLFRQARRHKGGVALFFDELDALATNRSSSTGGGAEREGNKIVIALLQMMDRHNGLIFAATNKPESIDPAIWRRFQLQIEVGLPAPQERFAIVKRYIHPFITDDETVAGLSHALAGASPALIREVIESLKRDLIIGPRLGHDLGAAAMFGRIRAASSPPPDAPAPPLWHEDHRDDAIEALAGLPWPPARPAA